MKINTYYSELVFTFCISESAFGPRSTEKENLEISHNYSLSATALDVSFLKTKYDYPPRSL